jgi:ribose-phosphate pyrophosphokinase
MASQSAAQFVRDDAMVLFSCPDMESLKREVLGHPDLQGKIREGLIRWERFEDGFPNLFIEDVESIKGKDVIFLVSLQDHSMLLSHISIMYALPRYMAKSLTICLPYFPTGTMERVEHEGQIATAHSLTRVISCTPISAAGPAKVLIYDIHALQERFYFSDSVVPVLLTATPLFAQVLATQYASEKIAIAFPDEGAKKRFGVHFKKCELVVCSKVRDGDKRIVKVTEGDAQGRHCFIVDDLVKTGGTLIECKDALLAHGAAKVSAYVTHAVFPQESWKRFTNPKPGSVNFDKFFISNSCGAMASFLAGKDPFVVLSLAPCLAQALPFVR